MPLTPKRPKLQADLVSILQDPNAPLNGRKLAKALSKFSLGILPPTIGVFTGIVPAAAAYDNAPPMDKTKGIEDAINVFAEFNATGMAPFAFKGTPPPKIRNLQRFFNIVKERNGTVEDIAKFLSVAILANYTLGRSQFTPLSILVPTWNIGLLPASITDSEDYPSNIERNKKLRRAEESATFATTAEPIDLDTDDFFEESKEPI